MKTAVWMHHESTLPPRFSHDRLCLRGSRSAACATRGRASSVASMMEHSRPAIDGDPSAELRLIEDPDKNFVMIIKDGKKFKDAIK